LSHNQQKKRKEERKKKGSNKCTCFPFKPMVFFFFLKDMAYLLLLFFVGFINKTKNIISSVLFKNNNNNIWFYLKKNKWLKSNKRILYSVNLTIGVLFINLERKKKNLDKNLNSFLVKKYAWDFFTVYLLIYFRIFYYNPHEISFE